jgi:hypothetical protein
MYQVIDDALDGTISFPEALGRLKRVRARYRRGTGA